MPERTWNLIAEASDQLGGLVELAGAFLDADDVGDGFDQRADGVWVRAVAVVAEAAGEVVDQDGHIYGVVDDLEVIDAALHRGRAAKRRSDKDHVGPGSLGGLGRFDGLINAQLHNARDDGNSVVDDLDGQL